MVISEAGGGKRVMTPTDGGRRSKSEYWAAAAAAMQKRFVREMTPFRRDNCELCKGKKRTASGITPDRRCQPVGSSAENWDEPTYT